VLSSAACYVRVLARIRSISEEVRFVCVDLNRSKFKCHLDNVALHALKSMDQRRVPKPAVLCGSYGKLICHS